MSSIAIDLGTASTRIFVPQKGIIVNEPSVVAINAKTREILSRGKEAYDMFGRTSKKIDIVFPLSDGMICDYYLIEDMIKFFLKKIKMSKLIMPKAVVCIPGDITDIQKMAAISAIKSAGIRRVYIMESPVAAAIGSGIEIKHPKGSFVVNVGAGTTDIAVTSLNGLVSSRSLRIAGDKMDEEIIKYCRKKHNLIIGKKMAEITKIKIGTLIDNSEEMFFEVKGRESTSGLPKSVRVSSKEIYEALISIAEKIIFSIINILERTSPELVGDILGDGISLSGGCAKLKGFKQLIENKTGLTTNLVDDPLGCVAKGAGESIKYAVKNAKNYGYINPLSTEI